MRFAFRVLAVLVVGVLLGLLATWLTVVRGGWGGGIHNGPWRTSLETGSTTSGPYNRARVALHGLFALNGRETIYFNATTDSDGNTFDGDCLYRLVGHDPATRWWSVTAYGTDDYLIPNPANRYSVSMNSVARRGDGSFVIVVSQRPGGANWIPVQAGRFSLTLRLYNPAADIAAHPATVALPEIQKGTCG